MSYRARSLVLPRMLDMQPGLLLAVLPPTVRQLHLNAPCRGPLFTVLQRFKQLQSVTFGDCGNAVEVEDWASRAAAAVIPKLTSLRLDCQGEPEWDGEELVDPLVFCVAEEWVAALAGATQLSSLHLQVCWTDQSAQLCSTLPALQHLRCARCASLAGSCAGGSCADLPARALFTVCWHTGCAHLHCRLKFYSCSAEYVADAVRVLEGLPQLRAPSLSFNAAGSGFEEDPFFAMEFSGHLNEYIWSLLPPMAQLADRLTALTLLGTVRQAPAAAGLLPYAGCSCQRWACCAWVGTPYLPASLTPLPGATMQPAPRLAHAAWPARADFLQHGSMGCEPAAAPRRPCPLRF